MDNKAHVEMICLKKDSEVFHFMLCNKTQSINSLF